MLKKVSDYIQKHGIFQRDNRVIVGVSGGADSMALLMCLVQLREELGLTLFVAHVNHGLRGNASNADSELTARTAEQLKLPFYLKNLEPETLAQRRGLSLEDAARKERYDFFFQLLRELPADKIALGHHANDQAETVLLNLLRGTGAKGLSGIRPVRDHVLVRPLLGINRKEILSFLKAKQVSYREDKSNRSPLFLRNRLRHELIPELKTYNPRFEERLCSLAEIMQIENDYWELQIHNILQSWGVDPAVREVYIPMKDFCNLHKALQGRVIKTMLESRSKEKNGIEQVHIQSVLKLIKDGHVGQKLSLPFQTEVVLEYAQILFREEIRRKRREFVRMSLLKSDHSEQKDLLNQSFKHQVTKIPDTIAIEETVTQLRLSLSIPPKSGYVAGSVAYIDYDKIELPLTVRTFQPGDRFSPLGLQGSKKLKSFFIDRKVPRESRRKIPLLADLTRIFWVGGMAISEDVKITPQTRTCLKIEII
ncbi:MAG: tRNA lysidine(34) synthetase TilS [Syntrophaceae bacterium]|nr:tRNA lysidine(34) synthetase TilS [Syntrophaceae bacterium]